MIVFFSGTGNSRFVAEKIAELTNDELCDAASFIRSGKRAVFTEPKCFVFVSPQYVTAPPMVFLDFIRNAGFPENAPAWFVMTCAGSQCGDTEYCRGIAREKGFAYLGTAAVSMPQNYIAFFRTKSRDENRKKVRQALPVIRELSGCIRDRRAFPDHRTTAGMHLLTKMTVGLYYRAFVKAKAFHTTEACVGCGYCAKACPMDNIRLVERRPVWGNRCTHCMACINLCPKDAIEYGKGSIGKPRYKGPETGDDADAEAEES